MRTRLHKVRAQHLIYRGNIVVAQKRLETFASWLRDVGVKVNKLGVSHLSPNGRGITATADIKVRLFTTAK